MSGTTGTPQETVLGQSPWRAALMVVGAITALRVLLLFFDRLELYPDEAQYWVWSRHLAFGYFSKPPMIAWLIRLTTAIGGDGEPWIRLSAPLLHGGAALVLARAGRRLYGARAGFWAATLYILMPGVLLSSAVLSTDAPLMLLLSLAVWAYAALWTATDAGSRRRAALALGVALGTAFLTKYAALYTAGGIALHALISRDARRRWDAPSLVLTVGAALVLAAPNLVWNAAHHFQTVAHTAENADLGGERGFKGLFGARGPIGFTLGQFGAFGPVPFGVLIGGTVVALRRRGQAGDTLLLCLILPALVIVFGEAVVARANANWAGAAYPPGAVLAAGLLQRWRMRRLLALGIGIEAAVMAAFFLCLLSPGLADAVGVANAFKRARGWRASSDAVVATARAASAQAPLSAIAVDDRFMINALSYYARDAAARPAGQLPAPLKAWVRLAKPENQAEAETPLTPANGVRVLGVSANPPYRQGFQADFAGIFPASPPAVSIRLDPKHARDFTLFIGQGFAPRPRPNLSGRSRQP